MSLDFFFGAFLAIMAIPFLVFAYMLGKRFSTFVGIAILAKYLGTTVDFIKSLAVLCAFFAFAIAVGMAGSMLLVKGVMMLWKF